MKRNEGGAGSLDMLLDTMCNTFGGVCFIALLVAVISASLPKDVSEGETTDPRKALSDRKVALLQRECDNLENAIAVKESLLRDSPSNSVPFSTAVELSTKAVAAERQLKALRDVRQELVNDLAESMTDSEYNRTEAQRLRKLEKSLREDLRRVDGKRTKVVRMPTERDVPGHSPIDYWIKDGALYAIDDPLQCTCTETGSGASWRGTYAAIPGKGTPISTEFLASEEARKISEGLTGGKFARVYADPRSFRELSLFINFLVENKRPYNWYPREETELVFHRGYDSTVQ